ncbi:MAG: aminotransferase class I/II-fold pyridoxal phosphate-dependent enzyme, partial [Deltaproteobacteria bacterium]|nr:aminotransferase class I/II-fold pyridoxal phosphate-dependent enzyme [Deltaproteobacteria bacterium]
HGAKSALTASQECVKQMVAEFDRRRKLLISCMNDMDMPCVRPQGAFYAFPAIKKYGMTSQGFADFLLTEAQVAVVPGDAFGESGEGHVRISYSIPYEEIEKGMERVAEAIKKL